LPWAPGLMSLFAVGGRAAARTSAALH
jgi:hypothetical protein